ncbi:hypothetical protein A9J41_00810 [Laribacter hongkongensis]|nr:hypothetical protein [Laribacter hongkongensis]
MGKKATDLCSPYLARVPMMVKAQKALHPMDVLLLGAQAVMPDSQRLAQHIEQAWRGSPIWLCAFRYWQSK